jgi:hypothetical protein
MKKTLIILVIVLAAIPIIRLVKADPGDVVLTITIRAADVQIAKAGILREHPVPMMDDPMADPNSVPRPKVQQYTDKQWITKLARDYLIREFRSGMTKLRADAANDGSPIN